MISLFYLERSENEFITGRMSDLVRQAVDKLRSKGLRVTDQRRAILKALSQSESPKSADETHAALPVDTCDPVTAYRCLEQFEKAGVVERGVRENGTKVYCLGHGHGHHHHLTCRKCGRTERIDLCMGEEMEKVAEGFGFTEVSHVMEAFGVCPSCG
ncbi:MAG TPA: transcriptional repressor [Opitutae bacterium]|nr:transcriptional repressor [Opitutae bacterium]|tara:strand:- start:322 stop:792 length:471 start_codon:yes stop_codon:yes gene_type:complete